MKYLLSALAFTATFSASTANPVQKRQQLDIAAYNAIPILPDVAAPIGDATPTTAVVKATEIANAAAAAIVAAPTATGAVTAISARNAEDLSERSIEKRVACDPRRPGTATAVNTPSDDAASFQAFSEFSSAASAASVVGYKKVYTGLAAAQDTMYLTYKILDKYDPNACAAYCQSIDKCYSFNIFYERDPSQEPGYSACKNPTSLTYVKCSLFGTALTAESAKNVGQWQADFHVVMAGSAIFVKTNPTTPDGFQAGVFYDKATINAPSGFIGSQTFPQTTPYDPSICAKACNEKSAFDKAQGLPTPQKPDICNFFTAYFLYKNGQNGVFTCAYYTSAWDSSYAVNTGYTDTRWNDKYTIGNAYGFPIIGAPVNGQGV